MMRHLACAVTALIGVPVFLSAQAAAARHALLRFKSALSDLGEEHRAREAWVNRSDDGYYADELRAALHVEVKDG